MASNQYVTDKVLSLLGVELTDGKWSLKIRCQVVLLQETSNKLEQENKFMTEALEDLQDSTSRLEAENRTLKMGSPRKGRAGSATSGKVRVRDDRLTHCATV